MMVIGSRGSKLALWQAEHVKSLLEARGVEARIEVIQTTGDHITDVPLAVLGKQTSTKGLFTKELEEALFDGRVDLAVHSLKDMPTELPEGLSLTAVPGPRADVRDALVGARLADLPAGAKVGTSALRRQAQLRALRPDLVVESIRGNVDTRLRKQEEGQYDAIVLAAAGLSRLGWADRVAEYFAPEAMCPAVGQGALAIETRAGDERVFPLDDLNVRNAVTAERALLKALGGGCQVPVGAHAETMGDLIHLRAVVAHPDGGTLLREELRGAAMYAEEIGRQVAEELLANGARKILEEVYGPSSS
jgi:hydroxymethylbilane synthase